MSEKQPGKRPDKPPVTEQEFVLYHRAARYPDAETSKDPYEKTQDLIRDNPCNLSVYRMRMGEEFVWHLAVIGTPPSEELDRRIIENLATGEPVTFSDGIVQFLNKRREQQVKQGQYVEKHHYPRRRTR